MKRGAFALFAGALFVGMFAAGPTAAQAASAPLPVPIGSDIADGSYPDGIAANGTTNMIYVANANSRTVSVISGATNLVTATVPVGNGASYVAIDESTNTVYVSNHNGVRSQ